MVSTLQLIDSYIAGCHTVLLVALYDNLPELRMQDVGIRISLRHKKKKIKKIIVIKNTHKAVPKSAKL